MALQHESGGRVNGARRGWGSETGTGQGMVRWVRQGPPAAGLSGWPSPHPHHHHCLGGDSPGGSLEEGMTGAGQEE